MIDLGEKMMTCEMCESAVIRYVHRMQHPSYPEILEVGCVCAENMSDDYVNPRARERSLRTLSRRRAVWDQKKWRRSRKMNFYLNTDGFNLVVFQRGPLWGYRVRHNASGKTVFSEKYHTTVEGAQQATLPTMLHLKEELKTR